MSEEDALKKAELYVRLFYDNIVDAVLKGTEQKVMNVLKAFEFSVRPENSFHLINCFEMSIAINFLNKSQVSALWKRIVNP